MASDATMDDAPVTATEVPDRERMEFLPAQFGRFDLEVERACFQWARRLIADHGGGFWRFFRLSNGGAYLRPPTERVLVRVTVESNGFQGLMTGEAAGIVVTLFALSHLIFRLQPEHFAEPDLARLVDQFHQLRDYATQHGESFPIMAAID